MKLSITLYFILVMAFSVTTCAIKPKLKVELINVAVDKVTTTKKISLPNLVSQYKSLDRQTIQTEGVIYFEFENVALCINKGQDGKCFWLEIDRDIYDDSLLQRASGQNFLLKGTIDTTRKGHLNAYLATIKNVYYLVAR